MTDGFARLFFAGELAALLTCPHESGTVLYPLDRAASIKDVVEALGVPHTEVYAILVENREQDFSLQLSGSRITFHPANMTSSYPVDVTRDTMLRTGLDKLRFLVDENVAGLASLLRVLDLDTAYNRNWNDEYIAHMAAREGRVVLTRDRGLLKRSSITHGRLIRSQIVDEQLLEVLGLFKLPPDRSAFSRCLRCNSITEEVDKQSILHLLEPKTRIHYDSFRRCPVCERIYWRGTHYDKLMERFKTLGIKIRQTAD